MSGSQVATQTSRKNVPVGLKRARPGQQEAQREDLPRAENNEDKEGGPEQDPLVKAERMLFGKRIAKGLARAGRALKAVESDVTLSAEEVEELARLTTLKALEERLPAKAWKVFRSGFSEEKWDELVTSEACILSESRAQLRTLRLKRHKQRLDESCETAIDLTVRDEDEVEEQSTLVNSCTVAVQKLLDRVGMNARGTVKRVVKARNPADDLPLAKAKGGGKKRVEIEGEPPQEENDRVVKQKQKSKAKSKAKEKRKVSTASEMSFEEEGEDANAEDDMVVALQPEKDKEEAEGEAEEEEDAEPEDANGLKSVFNRMREDVPVVAAMLKEAASGQGQVVLNVGHVCSPVVELLSGNACKALLANVDQLSRCLTTSFDVPDEVPLAEHWGVLLKWWRLVKRAISIAGLFEHLRGMRKGKKMEERYDRIVKRLKKKEGVLSYGYARRHDRLGQFLLKYPRFVNQLQLVSLADWEQTAGPQNVALMDAVEDILSAEEVAFWSKNVVGDAQQGQPAPAPPVPAMVEVFDAFEGQVDDDQLDQDRHFRDSMEVEAPDEPDFEDDAPAVVEEEECPKCGLKAQTVFLLCDGPGKKHFFCWKCDGYSGPPPLELPFPGCDDGTITIKSYVFCAEHLKLEYCTRPYELYKKTKTKGRKLMKIGDFVNHVQADEARQMVAIFTSPERQFSVVAIDPDGWCTFVAAAKGIDMDWRVLVKEMKAFAREYFKSDDNAAPLEDPQEARQLWNQLDPRKKKSVQAFWSSDAADLVVPMLAAHLNAVDTRAVQFRVWMIDEKGELAMTKLVNPEGEMSEFKKVVDLLKTNKIVEHYDLLKKNGP